MTSLFDDPEEWHEVPQAIYNSWPHALQLTYCAARDVDASMQAATADEAEWFLARAAMYRAMAAEAVTD